MKWSLDVHKYMGEVPRKALQILVKHKITSRSSSEEIDNAEQELAKEGVYDSYSSAKGRISRALFTYFRSYECIDETEQLTELGRLFAENKLSISEMSFASIVNKTYISAGEEYFPVFWLLTFLEKAREINPQEAFITPYDFMRIEGCNAISDISDSFVSELIGKRSAGVPLVVEREIGFDVWSKMLVQGNIFDKDKNTHALSIKNDRLFHWMIQSYRQPSLRKVYGSISSGILRFFPSIEVEKAKGDPEVYIDEAFALQAFLFDSIKPSLIDKYFLEGKSLSFTKMLSSLGLKQEQEGHFSPFSGLERLVGIHLCSDANKQIQTIGRILASIKNKKATKEDIMIEEAKNLEESRKSFGSNILLYGVPGSGKSHTIEHELCRGVKKENRYRLVFHPEYMYSDFVGQILPKVIKNEAEDGKDEVTYRFVPGPFTEVLKAAYKNPTEEYVLIIEELNRGNAPAIFGEIFQLLDRMGQNKADKENFQIGTSEYFINNENIAEYVYDDKKHPIRIPSNLTLLATMNTSDQNVFTLDTAFQRRWQMRQVENSFERVDKNLAEAHILDTSVEWQRFCTVINNSILTNASEMSSTEDKRLGVYFVSADDLAIDDLEYTKKEYLDLCKKDYDALSEAERNRLSEISKAMNQNRRFPEKVLKYLWDDAFKFNTDRVFRKGLNSLEKVISGFMENRGDERFSVFNDGIVEELTGKGKAENA